MKACLLAFGALVLAPATFAQEAGKLLSPREIINVLPGRWVMETEPEKPGDKAIDCDAAWVIRVRIIAEKNSFTYTSAEEGDPSHRVYRSDIQANAPNGDISKPGSIVLQYEGEDRLDAKGKLVVWHLFMTDRNTFWWHRDDWKDGNTTPPSHRCPDPDLVS